MSPAPRPLRPPRRNGLVNTVLSRSASARRVGDSTQHELGLVLLSLWKLGEHVYDLVVPAALLCRLRICREVGAAPQFVLCSATLTNASRTPRRPLPGHRGAGCAIGQAHRILQPGHRARRYRCVLSQQPPQSQIEVGIDRAGTARGSTQQPSWSC